MRIVVTGATGLIGQKLCRELLLSNHELVVVGRSPEDRFRERFTFPCEYHTWEDLKLDNIQAVFHLAGESVAGGRWTSKKKASIVNSRVDTTQTLASAFEDNWPEVFIGASAIGYYGNRDNELLSEKSPSGTGFLSDVCKELEASSSPFETHGRVVRFRFGIVLDPSGGFLASMERLFSLGLGGKVGTGKQWMSWIHSNDLIRMLIFSLENPITGTFNAVAPDPITNIEWTQTFANQLHVKALLPVPKMALKLSLGEMSQLATDSQRVSSEKIASQGFDFHFRSVQPALADLYSWKSRASERLFEAEQWISADRKDIFPFFSEAKNLEKITPPWLSLKILRQSNENIDTGTLIDYRIVLKGLPMRWRTEIKNWEPPQSFVDDQLKGPYKRWQHTHSFEQFPQGTLMKDHVVYELPFGCIGQIFAGTFVRNDISKIFSYRKKAISKLMSLWEKIDKNE